MLVLEVGQPEANICIIATESLFLKRVRNRRGSSYCDLPILHTQQVVNAPSDVQDADAGREDTKC